MRYKMVISYDGSKYYGFQRQKNVKSIQGELENFISKYLSSSVLVKGSGRTDKGVHAINQVVHFDTDKSIKGLKKYLNNNLSYIKVKCIKKVNDSFHARFSVKEKVYLYKISLNKEDDNNYYMILYNDVDLNKMRDASEIFLGVHDFRNFCSGEREDYITCIKSIKIYKINKHIYIKFIGSGFYRYMVRNLVGALISVGKGKCSIEELQDILDNKSNKRLPVCVSSGLYLVKVRY